MKYKKLFGLKFIEQDYIIKKIEKIFRVPERVAHQIKIIAKKVRGGYVIFESRPQWDNK